MKRAAVVLAAFCALQFAHPAGSSASPAADLCTADPARGPVPDSFVLDACVDGSAVTVRNTLDVPVAVARSGDAGPPEPVHADGGAAARALRQLAGPDVVLMPGDVVRWPLGAGPGELTVSGVHPAPAAPVAATLARLQPSWGSADVERDASLVAAIAAAVVERTSCVREVNFLRAAACDVTAASTIGRTAATALPAPEVDVVAQIVDPAQWDRWSQAPAADPDRWSDGEPRLVLAASPVLPGPAAASPQGTNATSTAPPRTAPGAAAPPAPGPPPAAAPAPSPDEPDRDDGTRGNDGKDRDDDEGKGKDKGKGKDEEKDKERGRDEDD